MATARQSQPPRSLYEQDFYAWTKDQSGALRSRQANLLDWNNLLEEVESMGASERRELISRLTVLLMHLIKWHWQPDKRSASWKHTVIEQRRQIRLLLKSSPSLKPIVPVEVSDAWKGAREDAAEETDMTISTFPEDCPWDIESQILGSSWWPN